MAAIELHHLSLQNPRNVRTFSMSQSLLVSSTSFSIFAPRRVHHLRSPKTLEIRSGLREIRARIDSVKSTQKITEAMKLVAAARVRRAQEAVVNGRPFAQTLADLFREFAEVHGDSRSPLTNPRPARKIAVVIFTTDRGLCGGLNAAVVKKAESRISELKSLGLECRLISVGKKGSSHFRRRYADDEVRCVEVGSSPTAKEAQVIADILFSMFFAEEVDKIELVYSRFVSLLKFEPVIQTLLPLKKNEIVDSLEDESFRLTSKEGKLFVVRETSVRKRTNSELLPPILEFEQDPDQILDAMLPLYLNSQVLRVLQESTASELASRMTAMSSATENADELGKSLSRSFNRQRQAKITGEILEIVAGAEALRDLD